MSSTTNGLAIHPHDSTYSEDEDKVVFKTPSDGSKSGSNTGAKVSSFVDAQRLPYSPSPLLLDGQDSTSRNSPNGPVANWTFPRNKAGSIDHQDPTWEVAEQMKNIQLTSNEDDATTLAPAAEITEQGADGNPHSRQSSAGDTSSFDSPAVHTPGYHKADAAVSDKTAKGPYGGLPGAILQNGYGMYSYDGHDGALNGMGGLNGVSTNGMMSPAVMHGQQAAYQNGMVSPIRGPGHPMQVPPHPPFSPSLMHPGDAQHYPTRQDEFSVNYGAMRGQNQANGRPGVAGGRGQQNGAANGGAAAYPTLNGQHNLPTSPQGGFAYGSPTNQGPLSYPAGLMSPSMTSPTFIPTASVNPYSPIHAPTPYSPYGAAAFANGYDPVSSGVMSPQASAGMLPANGRGQNQMRGHGYSASHPLSPGENGGLRQPVPNRAAPRTNQAPRGGLPTNAMNHVHSMSLPQSPYSPQLPPTNYPMSPPPFPGYYPALAPQMSPQQSFTPEMLQAMANLTKMSNMPGNRSPTNHQNYNNNSIQSALHGLQQDPSVMALIQAGGGPSANNRKLGLYKTELCRSWEEKGTCKYGEKCQFAHGEPEQRRVERHPKYKTEICRTFWVSGSCPYGKRCCFIHTELPASGAAGNPPPQGEGARQQNSQNTSQNERPMDGRARSMSTNSDPNDPPSSLLARISARAQANNNNGNGIVNRSPDASPSNPSINDPEIQEAIARAYSAYGLPAGQANANRVEPKPETPTAQAQTATTSTFPSFTSTRASNTPTSNGLGGGHHRVSASVDFGRTGRTLGSDLSVGLSGGHLGHQRNPSASSVVPSTYSIPQLSRTPLSGGSSPFGNSESSTTQRSVAVGSSLLDSHPW